MTESLYEILIDDDKRIEYCQKVIREGLVNEAFIDEASFNLAVDDLDAMIKIRGNPFHYHWDAIPEFIESSINFYIDIVQKMNEAVYGKRTLSTLDILGEEEYEKNKDLLPDPLDNSADGHSNDNQRICYLPY